MKMVTSKLAVLLGIASLAASRVLKRDDPPFQHVPTSAQPDNSFHVDASMAQIGMPKDSTVQPDAVYGSRSIDLPFGRLQHGTMKFFEAGELNTPTGRSDVWAPGKHDSAKQSACGIPDSAYQISKVAIHPYWLKFAPLERYCMQDACISFWNEERAPEKQSDMMLKITDICSTDPKDPTACLTPYDIKIDRSKAGIMERLNLPGMPPPEEQEALNGTEFKDGKTWWFFMKCWADGLAQPAYQSPKNWFTNPPIESNIKWAQKVQTEQVHKNEVSYAEKGWQVYPNGAFRMDRGPKTAPLLSDWKEGMPDPEWCPVAGGKGFGIPTGKDCSNGAPQTPLQTTPTNATGPATYGNTTQSDSQDTSQDTNEDTNEDTEEETNQETNQDTNEGSTPPTGNPTDSQSTVDDEPAPGPSLSTSPEPIPSGDVTSQGGTSSTDGSSGTCNSATGDQNHKNEEADDDDGTCAADEAEADEPEAKAEAPKVSQPKTSEPKTSEPKAETSNEGTDDDDTCAADEVWVDEL
ncbi:MAG: hypothetical protein L6R36_003657 [Xanthoria steineri]|nr:MAG: hypothetical protein L6R36_003657 [Xanthoria steineri]